MASNTSAHLTRLLDGHAPLGSTRYIWSDNIPPPVSLDDGNRQNIFDIELASVHDAELRSNYMAYDSQGEAITLGDSFHISYVEDYIAQGLETYGFKFSTTAEYVVESPEPLFIVSHFNMSTYGHFLLEVLPKILLARELRSQGHPARIAFPSTAAYVSDLVLQVFPESDFCLVDSETTWLRTKKAYLPTMLVNQRYDAHQEFVRLIGEFKDSVAESPSVAGTKTPLQPQKLFLSRARHKSARTLVNEAELFDIASQHGYAIVHPQELSWPDQIRLFANATHIIGEYTSALHNHIFAGAGARIMSLGRINAIVATMTASFEQEIGYVFPCRLKEYNSNVMGMPVLDFEIDPVEFASRLDVFDGPRRR
jgi:hypothetical protein